MASKFTKCMFLGAVIVGASVGIHYYLQKKEAEAANADDNLSNENDGGAQKGRSYISLNLDGGMAALNKAKDKITDSYNQVVDTVKAGLAGGLATRDFVDLAPGAETGLDKDGDINEDPAATGDISGSANSTVEEFFNEE